MLLAFLKCSFNLLDVPYAIFSQTCSHWTQPLWFQPTWHHLARHTEHWQGIVSLASWTHWFPLSPRDTPTLKHYGTSSQQSSPDVPFCSPHLSRNCQLSVHRVLTSDHHLPIGINYQLGSPIDHNITSHNKKATCDDYVTSTGAALRDHDVSRCASVHALSAEIFCLTCDTGMALKPLRNNINVGARNRLNVSHALVLTNISRNR